MPSGSEVGGGDAFRGQRGRRRCIQGPEGKEAMHSGSCDVGAAGKTQGSGALPALQSVLNHVLPLVL